MSNIARNNLWKSLGKVLTSTKPGHPFNGLVTYACFVKKIFVSKEISNFTYIAMCNSDSEKGKIILIITSILFLYYTLWIIGLPFIDDERLQALFPFYHFALMLPAISGFCFIGGLILFTLYHVRPYLSSEKFDKSL